MSHKTSELAVGGPRRWSPVVVPLHCAKRERAIQICVKARAWLPASACRQRPHRAWSWVGRLFGARCSPSPPEGVDTDAHWNRPNARPVSPETRAESVYDEGKGGSEVGDEDGQAEQGTAVPMVASSTGGQGDVTGQGAGGGAVGGRPANGRPPALKKKPNVPWTLDERMKLAILMDEDDALMADANGQHRFKQRKDRYAWVNDRMADAGFKHRSGEDCRKKWSNMLATAKLIVEKCEACGQPSYWDMSTEDRKEKSLALSFEKAVWDAMQWQLNRPSIRCDNTLASENLPGVGTDATLAGGSNGRCVESNNSAKSKRTATGKARKEDPGSSVL
ncbi:hypothetical protein CBR_g24358 [Chara braunii]|uniref:Myb-like domain-containing protein n=1 Tax=Chara braunii TaxID=69332 RepID=A0A388JMF8_CHABU|nr:hypothetical protein CBR_g24358 [Chara braunii]|eukprot:GBG59010.1 hypothetical protein CBR_g24358 [Chara braunii]